MAMAQNPEIHRVRRHAAQRHRHRSGGLCAAAGRDAGPAHRLRRHAFGRSRPGCRHSGCHGRDALKKIFILLRAQTGHDFSQYKPSTIRRRIERRMAVHQIEAHGRICQIPPADPRRGGGALSRPADRGDQFFPRPGGLPGARRAGHPQLFAGKPAGEADPRLGPRLFHRRGGLFPRHPAAGALEAQAESSTGADLRHRYRQPGDGHRPHRPLSREHRRRHHPGAAGALFYAGSRTAAPTGSTKASATCWSFPSRT